MPPMKAGLRDSLSPLFPDSRVGGKEPPRMVLDAARGGTAAAHFLLNDLVRRDRIRLSCSREGRPVRDAAWFRLVDVPVEVNTGPVGFVEKGKRDRNPWVVRRAPFRVYDAMEPVGRSFAAAGPAAAVRLHIPVPPDARPGLHRYAVRLDGPRGGAGFGLDVRVHRAVIPPAGAGSFPYTNWFSFGNMATRHGLKPWSEAHFCMIGNYARLMHHARQNTFLLPLECIFTRAKGKLVLDRPRLRKLVGTFTRAGLHTVEGGHWAYRTGGDWNAPTFSVALGGPVSSTPAGDAEIACGARQLMSEIVRNGWAGRWLQHAADEPAGDNAAEYRILVGIIRKYMPGIPVLDATMHTELTGSVDIWCPQCHEYQKHRAAFEGLRKSGDRIWFYTCCFPGGKWLNRLLDQELLRPALFGWAAARFGLDGFLHWGLNQYRKDQDPFRMSVVRHGATSCLPAGDTHIVYPGKGGPWSSLRLEAQREGCEDYELLRRLKERAPARAARVVRSAIRDFGNYVRKVPPFRAARRALLLALGGAR